MAARARAAMAQRRAEAERALRAMVLGGATAATVGARSLAGGDALIIDDERYFARWRAHSNVHLTLVSEGGLRAGFEEATRAKLALAKPRWQMLRKLCPGVVERLAPAGVRHPEAATAMGVAPQVPLATIGESHGVPPLAKRKLGQQRGDDEQGACRMTRARRSAEPEPEGRKTRTRASGPKQ